MSKISVFSAALVVPVTAPAILDGAIAVSNGHILHVGTRSWVLEKLSEQTVDERYWPGIITPGLVNAHSHLQYTGMAELGRRRYQDFDDWASAFNALYETPYDWAAESAAGAATMLQTGTTSVADIATDAAAASALHDAGLHGITYWEVMGWSNERWREQGRDQIVAELGRVSTPPGAGLSPHAPYSLDTEPLLDLPDIVRQRGLRLHIHLGESKFEEAFSYRDHGDRGQSWREAGAASFRALREHGFGMSATEFVDQLGMLGPDCHVAHGVYLTANDRALLRTRGTAIALCPDSNEVIGLDHAPVAAMLAEGNAIAVGTDSLSSSPTLDLMSDVAHLYRIARDQGYADDDLHARLLRAATLGGAHALGLDVGPHRVGQLQVGAVADLAFFESPVTDVRSSIAGLVEGGAGAVRATVLEGTIVVGEDRLK